MPTDPPTVPCGCCRGTGRVPLGDEYAATLAALARLGEASGADMGRALGIKFTAANNRLAALEKHGLAVSRRAGRKRLFRAKETAS